MRRRAFLASAAAVPLAGCAGVTRTTVPLGAEQDEERDFPVLAFHDESWTVGEIGVAPRDYDPAGAGRYFFALFVDVDDELDAERVSTTFQFAEAAHDWGHLYLRTDRCLVDADIGWRSGETTLELSEPVSSLEFVAEPLLGREIPDPWEMTVDCAVRLRDGGLLETVYTGSDSFTVELAQGEPNG